MVRSSMRDTRILWIFIGGIIVMIVAILPGLILEIKKGLFYSRKKTEPISKSGICLGVSCALIPAASLGVSHFFSNHSLQEKIIIVFVSFLLAAILLALGIWRMTKKENI